MLFKNYPSPSPRRLKVPVNRRFAGVSRGYGWLLTFHIAFTEPSPNLHPLVVKDRWKICESKFGMRIGWNAFVQGTCANIGEGERYFSKSSRAHGAPAREHYYALEIDWYSCVLAVASCELAVASHEIAVPAEKWYGFSKSGTAFQKVLRLFRVSAVPTAVLAIAVRKSYHFFA